MKTMPSVIHILIEEYNEDGVVYFLGTSPELEGLLIEADTIEKLQEEAPGVIKMYIDSANDIEESKKISFLQNFLISRKLNISYSWQQQLTLA